jgi:hypothetical protein
VRLRKRPTRIVAYSSAAAALQQSLAALPAVRANQVATWRADPPPSYQAYTRATNDLAKAIAGWRRVT